MAVEADEASLHGHDESVSSEAPSTISGVAIGRKTSMFVAPRPRNRWRTSAIAIKVPSAVATAVARKAIWSESQTELRIPATASQWIQLSKVNCSHV